MSKLALSEEIVRLFAHKETACTFSMVDMYGLIKKVEADTAGQLPAAVRASYQQTILHTVKILDKEASNVCVIGTVDTKYAPKISAYSLKNGGYYTFKVPEKYFVKHALIEGDVIKITNHYIKYRTIFEDGKRVETDEKDLWINGYDFLVKSELRK